MPRATTKEAVALVLTIAPRLTRSDLDLRDVRVLQRGERMRLAFEPLEAYWVGREQLGNDLDRHGRPRVPGSIDLGHPADVDDAGDLV